MSLIGDADTYAPLEEVIKCVDFSIQAEFYTGEPHPPNHASTPGAFLMAVSLKQGSPIEREGFLFLVIRLERLPT